MTILMTLGPLLAALFIGYWCNVRALSATFIDKSLKWLTMAMLALIGYSIGGLEDLQGKLYTAGVMALTFFALISVCNIAFLTLSGKLFDKSEPVTEHAHSGGGINLAVFSDSLETVFWVVAGGAAGYFTEGVFHWAEALVTWMLYLLLFLIGRQLYQGNYRLRSLFLNVQGLIIGVTVLFSTLLAGAIGAWVLGLPLFEGMAVVSGFGWYSLSGILLTDLGSPELGTTAFLLDIGREVFALMLIPLLSRINSHCGVGYSGATAMDFTLPMLGKFHGAIIIPTAIASGFVLSMMVPVLIPLFLSF
ncbi:MAG: lysine exporter LysO family protein [Pseudomonadales bacterium]